MLPTFVPRKCSVTNTLILPKDHGSIHMNIVNVDANGILQPGSYVAYAISGPVRAHGESDDALNCLAEKDGLLKG
jgi:small subunit ribosomal protein S21e